MNLMDNLEQNNLAKKSYYNKYIWNFKCDVRKKFKEIKYLISIGDWKTSVRSIVPSEEQIDDYKFELKLKNWVNMAFMSEVVWH